MESRKVFKLSSTLLIFSLSLFPLIATKSQAHIKCPIREPIFGTTNDACPHPPHLEGLSEEAWGEAGRIAYVSAAATMARRSPTGESLDASLKNALRPHFGGLVDRVTLHWGTPGLDKWSANKIGINLSGTESDGQTYGRDIYLDLQKPSSYSQYVVKLIIHEMVHSAQYKKWGSSLSNFGYHYFKNYKKAGQNYENNPLEKEAKERANSLYNSVYVSLNSVATRYKPGFYSRIGMNPPGIIYLWPSPWDGGKTDVWCNLPNHEMFARNQSKVPLYQVKDLETVQQSAAYWSEPCTDGVFAHSTVQQ